MSIKKRFRKDNKIKVIRHWCIICDCIWKNLRVSKEDKCYYNINPFTYEYNVNTEEEINKFLNRFNNFAKYNKIYPDNRKYDYCKLQL